MRIPRRNFVVEYKTNRRQPKERPASIWGNMDLKAVARDLESESILPKTEAGRLDFSEQPVADEPVARHPDDVIATPSPERGDTEAPAVAMPDTSPVDGAPKKENVGSAPASSSKPQRGRRASAQAHKGEIPRRSAARDDHPDTPIAPGSEEELLALEAENRRLKRLMVKKLRAENELLKAMLLRFDGG